MDRRSFLVLAGSALVAPYAYALTGSPKGYCITPVPPVTLKHPKRIVQLGRVRVDDYAWLKPSNWKQVWQDPSKLSKPIRAHLEAENAYAEEVLAPTKPLQHQILREVKARSVSNDVPPPYPMGPWLYYFRYPPGAQQPNWYRKRRGVGDSEELLVDGTKRAQGDASFKIINATPSPDQNFFAWAEETTGSEHYRIYVKDLTTGEVLPHSIQNAYGPFVFTPDSQWIFWVYRSANSRPTKVFRRPVHGAQDTLVYHETSPKYLMTVSKTDSGRYVMIRSWNATSSEVRLIPGADPTAQPQVVEPRTDGLVYSLEDWQGRLIILTNADGATNFKLMWADPSRPSRKHWHEWVAYNPKVFITDIRAFRDYFVRKERINANPRLIVTRVTDASERPIKAREAAYVLGIAPHQEYASTTLRYTFQSPRQPKRWVAYDMATQQPTTLQAETVGGDFRPEDYVVERVFGTASDGARVPITVLRHKHTKLDGSAPLFMYGYGAYGVYVKPEFSSSILSLVDRGWVYAIAHVRGGSAMGWDWYLQARQLHKKLTFTDFISCAETLTHRGYGSHGRIVMYGFSAGGLLVGAVLNMRPDLFAGAIGEAPFVDILNTMSDMSLPLVPLTYPDWGNPLASKAIYDYMISYSPYDNVVPQAYPPVLATTSIADDRVGFWEPAKWIAKLRADDTSHTPKMLRLEEGGHGGSAGRVAKLKQHALFYAFAIWSVTRNCT